MLILVSSPMPGVLQAGERLPGEAARAVASVRQRQENSGWVVPTCRRKRAMVHDWLEISPSPPAPGERGEEASRAPEERAAAVLPRFFTLESFVAEALQYSPRQKPRISGPERLLRLAGAWQEL